MLFLGDLACPEEKIDEFISSVRHLPAIDNEVIIVNLEGAIVDSSNERKPQTLFNVSRVIEAFDQSKKLIVSLANNHMYDYPDKILSTKELLEARGVGTFGIQDKGVAVPYECKINGKEYAFFGHCWHLYTKTNSNRINKVRIADCDYKEFVRQIASYKEEHADTLVYCFMHWNYDLEILPFPLHRTLSRNLIDNGAEAVIGSHSHVPQGVEMYKGKTIAYCLGNFYLPSGYYFEGTLSYPPQSRKTYGVRIDSGKTSIIWFNTDCDNVNTIISQQIEEDTVGPIISGYSEFANMNNSDYLKYFRKRRINNILVPVFGKYDSYGITKLQEGYAISRVKVIKTLQRIIKGDRA